MHNKCVYTGHWNSRRCCNTEKQRDWISPWIEKPVDFPEVLKIRGNPHLRIHQFNNYNNGIICITYTLWDLFQHKNEVIISWITRGDKIQGKTTSISEYINITMSINALHIHSFRQPLWDFCQHKNEVIINGISEAKVMLLTKLFTSLVRTVFS